VAKSGMDPRNRFNDPEEADRRKMEAWQTQLWTALPTIVEKHNTDQNTSEIQPAVKLLEVKPDGTKKWTPLPLLKDVPVHYYGGGGATITVPIQKGDEGIVVFSSRSMDKWWQQGGVQEQVAARMHDISDGWLIPGGRSQPRRLKNVSKTTFQIRDDSGSNYIDFNPVKKPPSREADGRISLAVLPSLKINIEDVINVKSFAGSILHNALNNINHVADIGNMLQNVLKGNISQIANIGNLVNNALSGNILKTALNFTANASIKATLGGIGGITINAGAGTERDVRFFPGIGVNITSPIVQMSANLKAFGKIDAALGFFINGKPIGISISIGGGGGGGGGGGSAPPLPTDPYPPTVGDFYWDPEGGQLYIWYDDGNSAAWVAATNQTSGPPGPQGPPGPPGTGGSGGGIAEAPLDGVAYGRQNATWTHVLMATNDIVDGGNF
jgi:Phage protein Gp138 N-terminal domain